MKRAVRSNVLTSTLVVLALAGCASHGKTGGSTPRSSAAGGPADARAAAFPIDAAAWGKLGYKWDWTGFPYVSPRGHVNEVQVYPDAIVAQESGSAVSVLEASTGSQRWSNTLANPLTRFVGTVRVNDPRRGDVFLTCSQSEVYFLGVQTGTLLDRQTFEKVVNTRPLVSGDRLIFGAPIGEVFSHWLDRSMKVWGFGTSAAVEANIVRVNDTTVAAVNQAGQITFLSDSGSLSAQAQIFGGPGAALAAGNNVLYIASSDQSLYAYAPDGRELWRLRTNAPLTQAPFFHEGVLFCSLAERGMSAFNAGNGKPLWNNKDVHGHAHGVRKGRLLVHDGDKLVTLDMARGDTIDSIPLPGLQEIYTDKADDGNLYAVSTSGVIAKFLPR